MCEIITISHKDYYDVIKTMKSDIIFITMKYRDAWQGGNIPERNKEAVLNDMKCQLDNYINDIIKWCNNLQNSNNFVSLNIPDEVIDKIDKLIEIGLVKNRSEGLKMIYIQGIATQQDFLDEIESHEETIRLAKASIEEIIEQKQSQFYD